MNRALLIGLIVIAFYLVGCLLLYLGATGGLMGLLVGGHWLHPPQPDAFTAVFEADSAGDVVYELIGPFFAVLRAWLCTVWPLLLLVMPFVLVGIARDVWGAVRDICNGLRRAWLWLRHWTPSKDVAELSSGPDNGSLAVAALRRRRRFLIALYPIFLFVAGYCGVAALARDGARIVDPASGDSYLREAIQHSKEFYLGLRWAVLLVGAALSILSVRWGHPRVAAVFGVAAALFNPVLPIHLSKAAWQAIDGATAFAFLSFPGYLWPSDTELDRARESDAE